MAHTVTLITHPNRLGVEEPLGYRFAVHVTPADDAGAEGHDPIDPADLSSCVNAGWRATLDEANLDGQTQAATAVGALRKAGLEATTVTIASSTDYHPPTPTEQ